MPGLGAGCGWVPGGDSMTVGASSHGAAAVTLANFDENSPNDRCCALWSTRPNAAISQNAVVPPLPSTTSYPFGQLRTARPSPPGSAARASGPVPAGARCPR